MLINEGDLIEVSEDKASEIINAHKMRAKSDEDFTEIDKRVEYIINKNR